MLRSIANSIPVGTSDVFGFNARIRDYVLDNIKCVYERYGFEPLYTPILENAEVFHGHHGEGEKLLFNLTDKNGEELVLKYDSTVPLARVVSMYPEIPKPYKRYQLQQSFRDDNVDKGHFREFIQCDGDIVGTESLLADAEITMIAHDGLAEIGFTDFTLRLNHRKIIHGIAEKSGVFSKDGLLEIQRAIDYADKIIKNGLEGIREDLQKRQVSVDVINTICDLVQRVTDDPLESLDNIEDYLCDSPVAIDGINDLKEILSYIPEEIRSRIRIDFTLARGADYYTGFILEAVINNIELGAVLGGGRFDNLVEAFSSESVPAVGMAFGLERILTAMNELKLTEQLNIQPMKILIQDNDFLQKEILKCATELRQYYDVSVLYGQKVHHHSLHYAHHCKFTVLLNFKDATTIEVTSVDNSKEYVSNVQSKLLELGYTCI